MAINIIASANEELYAKLKAFLADEKLDPLSISATMLTIVIEITCRALTADGRPTILMQMVHQMVSHVMNSIIVEEQQGESTSH